MAYLAIAYPEFEKSDFDWIQEYRQKHDRQHTFVEPHITLVFAVQDVEQDTFINEIEDKLTGFQSFDFIIRVATINKDNSGNYFHEFLVPDEGFSNVVKLHDRLYSGSLADHLRHDIDFIPHISIGDSENVSDSRQRVDELNYQSLEVKARISTVDIIEFKDGAVTTIRKVQLK